MSKKFIEFERGCICNTKNVHNRFGVECEAVYFNSTETFLMCFCESHLKKRVGLQQNTHTCMKIFEEETHGLFQHLKDCLNITNNNIQSNRGTRPQNRIKCMFEHDSSDDTINGNCHDRDTKSNCTVDNAPVKNLGFTSKNYTGSITTREPFTPKLYQTYTQPTILKSTSNYSQVANAESNSTGHLFLSHSALDIFGFVVLGGISILMIPFLIWFFFFSEKKSNKSITSGGDGQMYNYMESELGFDNEAYEGDTETML